MTYDPLGGSTEIEDALKVGEKVRAVSLYRASNSCTLAEAKAAIERAQRP
jgi:ribosomal protein L7/L12